MYKSQCRKSPGQKTPCRHRPEGTTTPAARRPGDLAQRKGRIERQGNQNETVHVLSLIHILADQLHDAVKYIRGTYQEAALPELGEGEDIDESLPADPNVKNYSYTVVDGCLLYTSRCV